MHEGEPAAADGVKPGDGPAPWQEPVRGGHPSVELMGQPGAAFMRALREGGALVPPISRLTGLELQDFAPGSTTFTFPLSGWLAADDGRVPLGVLTIPADAAMACAIIATLPPDTSITTSELALRQVRPVRPGGRLVVRGTMRPAGPPVAFAEATLTDQDGELVAHAGSLCVTLPAVGAPPPPAPGPAPSGGPDGPTAHDPDPWQRPVPPGGTPLQRLTGMRPVEIGRGEATFALPASPWLCAPPPGRVQGGSVATLAGAAITAAIDSVTDDSEGLLPVELKLNYLRPLASDGREALAHARLVHGGRRVAVASAEVVDADGRAIAIATGSAVRAE